MRLVIQRVSEARVEVDKKVVGQIQKGFLILVGLHHEDTFDVVHKLAQKVHQLRIFEDENGKMNLNLEQVKGSVLAISQFTLYGDASKGNRPSFITAARPEIAEKLYDLFCTELMKYHHVQKGVFGSHMEIYSINDGPVTIVIDS